ncbi:thioredoxin family protein [Oerskovia enterophila]|uniref:thioredoxin family protein n=1 Tax=Oerskovia enterophila TaxID=43678 RepID=UPI003399011E
MTIELLYFDGCPSWTVARDNLAQALELAGCPGRPVELVEVLTDEHAAALAFPGSPTLRLDGRDLFEPQEASGLTCRLYPTPQGLAGAPTVGQLVDALTNAG